MVFRLTSIHIFLTVTLAPEVTAPDSSPTAPDGVAVAVSPDETRPASNSTNTENSPTSFLIMIDASLSELSLINVAHHTTDQSQMSNAL
jgi:hypothetical protein